MDPDMLASFANECLMAVQTAVMLAAFWIDRD